MPIIAERPSPNQDARPCAVDTLVLHYTGMQSAQAAIDRLRDAQARVSSHYVVDEEGCVVRLVPEARRAWHAGISYWRGRTGLNDSSVGIEIVNPGHEWGYRPFPAAQMAAVAWLCHGILRRHAILPRNVVGHSDIAPNRKQDPGELFPWQILAEDGIGLWPAHDGSPGADTAAMLAQVGYDMSLDFATVVTAFQRHWLPAKVTGIADPQTVARLAGVVGLL
jgi:N-acetylmuramoyl-L-alanine amidase